MIATLGFSLVGFVAKSGFTVIVLDRKKWVIGLTAITIFRRIGGKSILKECSGPREIMVKVREM